MKLIKSVLSSVLIAALAVAMSACQPAPMNETVVVRPGTTTIVEQGPTYDRSYHRHWSRHYYHYNN